MIAMANNNTEPQQKILEDSQDEITTEAEKMIEDKDTAFYSRGVPVVTGWMALSFFAKMKYHQVSFTSTWTIMYLACLVLSSLTDMVMSTIFGNRQFCGRWMMAYLSTILQISAATALMLFFNTTDTVTIVFPLFGLVLVLLIYLFSRMFGRGIVIGRRWLEFKELLDRGFEMSAMAVAPSVAGLSGKVLGYVEVEGSASNRNMAVAPESFLFYSAVSGLLVLLFCTVPPALSSWDHLKQMAKVYIPSIAYMAQSFLVLATVVAAEKILHEYVYLVCCPIIILAPFLYLCDDAEAGSCCRRKKNHPPPLSDETQKEANQSKYLYTTGISPILLAIMAIHSRYGIRSSGSTVSLSWSWKAFVSSAVCSILSHTVRIFILDKMTDTKRYEISRQVWKVWTYASIACSAVFAVLVIYLNPDEVKNIF